MARLLSTALIIDSNVLWRSCCRIHRYVATPSFNFPSNTNISLCLYMFYFLRLSFCLPEPSVILSCLILLSVSLFPISFLPICNWIHPIFVQNTIPGLLVRHCLPACTSPSYYTNNSSSSRLSCPYLCLPNSHFSCSQLSFLVTPIFLQTPGPVVKLIVSD